MQQVHFNVPFTSYTYSIAFPQQKPEARKGNPGAYTTLMILSLPPVTLLGQTPTTAQSHVRKGSEQHVPQCPGVISLLLAPEKVCGYGRVNVKNVFLGRVTFTLHS